MFDNLEPTALGQLERQRDREALRRRMLEQQAINSDPDTFDDWADKLDACDAELRRLFFAILKAKEAYTTGAV